MTAPVLALMLNSDASAPVRDQLLVSPASGSVAIAVYTTVLAGALSATLAVAPEITVGASSVPCMVTVMSCKVPSAVATVMLSV
ncbi:hypothetical protein, partial [Mesorhizobium sp. B2-3-10]|uniref:hypothetical protein n=1 Tax=Mesorhizobium sp. B2-3-10 TaxID=2589954 RepID=UPI001FEE71C6